MSVSSFLRKALWRFDENSGQFDISGIFKIARSFINCLKGGRGIIYWRTRYMCIHIYMYIHMYQPG